MPTQEPLTSPRLDVLQRAWKAGSRAAFDFFWQEVTTYGTPLLEPIPGDEQNMLVTFLWRSDAEVTNAVLISYLFGAGASFALNQMTRLLDTDLWYFSQPVRRDARATYWFSVNDPLVPFELRSDEDFKLADFRADPLNPRTFVFPPEPDAPADKAVVRSVVEMPEAALQPWILPRPGVPEGSVTWHNLSSRTLGNEHPLWIYTPPGYTTQAEPYHLLLLFDGRDHLTVTPTPTTLNNLIAADKIPPLVAVLLDFPDQATRNRELACYPPFDDFLARELLPWLHHNYHISHLPAQVIVGGASYGGLAATYTALNHPEIYGHVLSQSGSYWWKPEGTDEHEWLTRQFVTRPKLPLQFYLDVGLFERTATPDAGPTQLVANRHLRDVLQAKGYPLRYAEFSGGHEYLNWRGTLADGLIALIGQN